MYSYLKEINIYLNLLTSRLGKANIWVLTVLKNTQYACIPTYQMSYTCTHIKSEKKNSKWNKGHEGDGGNVSPQCTQRVHFLSPKNTK